MTSSILLQLALIIAGAKIAGELCERRLKQPAVLAEIVVGILLGVSGLKWLDASSLTLADFGEVGAVLLLFEVGLESDIDELMKVGREALFVAVAGVALPFAMGFLTAHAMGLPTLSAIFVGAALTATSVGITARVFSDLGALHTREAQIVLGAAVADDVIGLIILAAVSGLAATTAFSWAAIAKATVVALLFLIGAIIVGFRASPYLLRAARAMRTRAAMSSAAVVACLLLATLAGYAGLAPIVGAFAAGLVLAKAESKLAFEEKVRSIADLFVPVFFVMMGARMDLWSIKPNELLIGLLLLVVAIVGKMIAGMTLPARGVDRTMIGFGMIPRGEVGLIFASLGLSQKIIDSGLYAALIFVVVATTFLTPPLLKLVVNRVLKLEIQRLEFQRKTR